jgi:hypothetical protein
VLVPASAGEAMRVGALVLSPGPHHVLTVRYSEDGPPTLPSCSEWVGTTDGGDLASKTVADATGLLVREHIAEGHLEVGRPTVRLVARATSRPRPIHAGHRASCPRPSPAPSLIGPIILAHAKVTRQRLHQYFNVHSVPRQPPGRCCGPQAAGTSGEDTVRLYVALDCPLTAPVARAPVVGAAWTPLAEFYDKCRWAIDPLLALADEGLRTWLQQCAPPPHPLPAHPPTHARKHRLPRPTPPLNPATVLLPHPHH